MARSHNHARHRLRHRVGSAVILVIKILPLTLALLPPGSAASAAPRDTTEPALCGSVVIGPGPGIGIKSAPPDGTPALASTDGSPRSAQRGVTPSGTVINVVYHGFPSDVQTTFQAAVDTWAAQIGSAVPITVDATWAPLAKPDIASTQPVLVRMSPDSVWYPKALADRLTGRNLDPTQADMAIVINSTPGAGTVGWYLGTEGRPGYNQLDLATTVLHELAHGLGIAGLLGVPTATGPGGGGQGGPSLPTVFDTRVATRNGQRLVADGSDPNGLGAALSRGLEFDGYQAALANGGRPPQLYSPAVWQPGSSVYHTDPTAFPPGGPNSLMDPGLHLGEVVHDPGPVLLGVLDDLGWLTVPGPAVGLGAVGGDGQATASWSAPAFTGGAPVTGYLVTATDTRGRIAAQRTVPISPGTLKGLANGVNYTIVVTAVNTVGPGARARPAVVTVGPTGPVPPVGPPRAASAPTVTQPKTAVVPLPAPDRIPRPQPRPVDIPAGCRALPASPPQAPPQQEQAALRPVSSDASTGSRTSQNYLVVVLVLAGAMMAAGQAGRLIAGGRAAPGPK